MEQLTERLLSSERRLTSVRLENEGLKSRVALGDTRVADLLAKIDALEQELAQYRARGGGGANGFGHPMRALPGVRVAAILGDAAAAVPVASRIAAAMSSSTLSSSSSAAAVAGGRAGGVRASRSSSAVRDAGEGGGSGGGSAPVNGAANGFQPSGLAADSANNSRAQSIDKVLEDSRAVLDYVNTVLPRSSDALPHASRLTPSVLTIAPTTSSTAYMSGLTASIASHVPRYERTLLKIRTYIVLHCTITIVYK